MKNSLNIQTGYCSKEPVGFERIPTGFLLPEIEMPALQHGQNEEGILCRTNLRNRRITHKCEAASASDRRRTQPSSTWSLTFHTIPCTRANSISPVKVGSF